MKRKVELGMTNYS